ncbi:MAG: hypothetical protein JNJ46_23160 [Myxococcales bacterium]|nr:hypothetical protein [Myxococcales bacterium]
MAGSFARGFRPPCGGDDYFLFFGCLSGAELAGSVAGINPPQRRQVTAT